MRKLFSKTTLAAGFALALALTFSACGEHGLDNLLDGDSSSSGGGSQQTWNHCITAAGLCLTGPYTANDCNGQVANTCPNSGGAVSSSSIVVSSSSVGSTPSNYSLDGVWVTGNSSVGYTVTVSGNSGILSSFTSTQASWLDAVNKGYIKVGTSQMWRNLTSTGNLTWSGQQLTVTSNTSSPNVAIGTDWSNVTITMSANGQTITVTTAGGNTYTYTRGNYSLDGVWVDNTSKITVSGNSGILSSYTGTTANWLDAINKGYIKVGTTQDWRNLTSTGNLTWSGQMLSVQSYTSTPNVAIGTQYNNITLTMSANGQTVTVRGADSGGNQTIIYTRQR